MYQTYCGLGLYGMIRSVDSRTHIVFPGLDFPKFILPLKILWLNDIKPKPREESVQHGVVMVSDLIDEREQNLEYRKVELTL